jgi:hypothetical protein
MMRRLIGAIIVALLAVVSSAGAQNNRATINHSRTVVAGNTFQKILSAGTPWSITIENNNASDSCWIAFGVSENGTPITAGNATKAQSVLLLPGGSWARYYPYVPSDEIEGTCASTSDTLYVDTQ